MTAWVARLGAALALAALAILALAAPAPAHDTLRSADPADGAVVARVPAEVVLTFDAPAQALGTVVVVTGPDGEVQQGAPRLVDRTVAQGIRGGSPAGPYQVAWRVTSSDGHPVSGTLAFTARAASPARAGDAAAADETGAVAPHQQEVLVALVLLLVVVAVGLLLRLVVRRRRALRRRVRPPAGG